eukprot:3853629-Pleurochrysis_carterae.AAC.1
MRNAGAGGDGPQRLRGGRQRSRRREGGAADGAERGQDADGVQGLQTAPGELPVLPAQMQIFPMQPSQERDPHCTEGHGPGGREEGENADVARRQRQPWKRGGSEPGLGKRWQTGRRSGRGVEEGTHSASSSNGAGQAPQKCDASQGDRVRERVGQAWTQAPEKADLKDVHANPSEQRKIGILDDVSNCPVWEPVGKARVTMETEAHMQIQCAIFCGIAIAIGETGILVKGDLQSKRGRRQTNHVCWIERVIQSFGQERAACSREHLKGTMDNKMLLAHGLTCICWIGIVWFMHREKQSTGSENVEKERAKNKRSTKAKNKARGRIRQRRLIQQRIRKWNKARKAKYDGKDRMKYRQKVRASKRWLRRANSTEAKE